MSADRESYRRRQEAFLGALSAGASPPAGFDVARLDATAAALARKRARLVARAWPALALGPAFMARFVAWARTHPLGAADSPLSDGLTFVRTLPSAARDDDVRVEIARVRAALRRRRCAAVWLPEARRVAVAWQGRHRGVGVSVVPPRWS